MSGKNNKIFKKLQKKRIWPSIVLFIGFIMSCIIIITLFIQFFATYIVASNITQLFEENHYIGSLLDEYMTNRTMPEALNYLRLFLPRESNVYVTDREGNKVAQIGNA